MDLVSLIVQALPFAFASGVNLYATVAVVGVSSRLGLFVLPEQFQGFDSPWVIGIALALYVVEFVADKVPWVDTAWDAVHTVVRPIGGALVAMGAVGAVPPEWQVGAALLGGSVALTTHLTKAGTRAVVNTSPEPFSNWVLSFAEDVFVVALTWVAVEHPVFAALVAAGLLLAIALFASVLLKALRRRARG
ncbi:MAG: DUF4126 domain-containing protein [Vicinamibacterales bacterium]